MAVAQYRAMGPRNATLPQATQSVIGFIRNPDRYPYLKYCQLVALEKTTEGLYRFPTIEPDEPARLVDYYNFGWGWDDKRPSGEDFKPRVTWTASETKRWAFGYTLGERTQGAWTRNTKINPQNMYNRIRLGHAGLHRASRAVDTLRSYSWPASQTSTLLNLPTIFGQPAFPSGVGFDISSGTELMPATGLPNPNFQIIKQAQNIVMRIIDLLTNGALTGEEFVMVFGPYVAQKLAVAGEIVNYLKQQANAKDDLMVRNKKWGIPDRYNGWELIVEDTPRVFIRPTAATTSGATNFASVTTALTTTPVGFVVAPNQRDYIWNDDSVFFGSRSGGLDGGYGESNFSTLQMFYNGGLANVMGRTDAWNELIEGSIDMEDDFQVAAPLSGFWLTATTTTGTS